MAAKTAVVGIRLKLSAAFASVSLVIGGFALGAIMVHFQTIERAALFEAANLAKIVAYGGTERAYGEPELVQRHVESLRALSGRDLVFVDYRQHGIADADTDEIGKIYDADPEDEVGQTLQDGRVRTFTERNERHPHGIRQAVVPLLENLARADSRIIGAAIVEYTHMYDELLAAAWQGVATLGFAGIACVLASLLFGLRVAGQLARRIGELQEGVSVVAAGNYDTRVPVRSRDELGVLGAAFNRMAAALKSGRDALVEYGRRLEERVAARTDELSRANARLRIEAEERAEAERALRESEARYKRLFDHSPDGMLIHTEGKIALVNGMCTKLLGATAPEQLIGKPVLDIFHPDYRAIATERLRELREKDREAPTVQAKVLRLDGSALEVEVAASPFSYHGKPSVQMVMRDVTERKKAEERLTYLAQYDSLTNLPNRILFIDRLEQAMAHARRGGRPAAVLFVDLDRFKLVNDTLGHAFGDDLLRQAAARLAGCLRSGDTAGRFGGDEFGAILSDLAKPGDAGLVAQKISEALAKPYRLAEHDAYVTASIGVTLYPADGADTETLMMNADTAMYRAKEQGRNNYQYFTREMNERAMQRMHIEAAMRRALARQEFVLHYQPKIDIASGTICGLEALLRWAHPDQGLVSPGEFIPVLEDTGLIIPVGEWVLREACGQARAWQAAGLNVPPIAVNLSARQFQQKNLEASVRAILEQTGAEPRLLQFEITESLLMHDPEGAEQTLRALKAAGIQLAVDDFGTGYSSLAYLKRFPLDALKIDRAFIRDIVTDPDDASITLAIISLAHSLKLKVVAEGVETETQFNLLALHSCDEMQGYYFSKPVPAAELEAMLREGRRLTHSRDGRQARPAVLLLDDNADDLELLKRALRAEEFEVLTASNVEQAFLLLASHAIGVVISDQNMPGISGAEFLGKLRKLYPDALRVVVTGSHNPEAFADAVNEAGIHKFLSKHWDRERLRLEVREAYRRYRAAAAG